jgi:hypothetical protein
MACALIRDQYELFDSSGNGSQHFSSLGLVGKVQTNLTRLQSLSSDTCGQFVLFYLITRALNLDLDFEDFK